MASNVVTNFWASALGEGGAGAGDAEESGAVAKAGVAADDEGGEAIDAAVGNGEGMPDARGMEKPGAEAGNGGSSLKEG